MPNRFQSNQYRLTYQFVAERDGEYCLACFAETSQHRGPKSVKLQIDHANNDLRDWIHTEYLHLLCSTHNIKFRSLSVKTHVSLMATYSAKNESERFRLNLNISPSRRAGLYQIGSPEMQVNSIALEKWKSFMHDWIRVNGSISKENAINAGAMAADDIDIQTAERYYKKYTSILGPFKEVRVNGLKYVVYREMQKT